MGVSRSGYHKYQASYDPGRVDPDFYLVFKVRQIFAGSRSKYGSRRMSEQLRLEGYDIGRYRAGTLMKKANVHVKYKKKFKRTTDSNHNQPIAPNLLNREFGVKKPNVAWCTDITYLWTNEGWLYLSIVIDLFSRKVVGWAIDKHMRQSLVQEALTMAYFRRRPGRGLIHHSVRGSQYAAFAYQGLLKQYSMVCSMSRKGNCWDNAVAESFFHTLKTECTDAKLYLKRDEARSDVIEYIEMFYNSHRLHSFLNYKSSNGFECKSMLNKVA